MTSPETERKTEPPRVFATRARERLAAEDHVVGKEVRQILSDDWQPVHQRIQAALDRIWLHVVLTETLYQAAQADLLDGDSDA